LCLSNACGDCSEENDLSCLGCTDPGACNYSDVATEDDGSCDYLSCVCAGTVVSFGGGSWINETSWTIADCEGNVFLSGGGVALEATCVENIPSSGVVTMTDSFGDSWN
jgi:hypothetical protein